MAWRKASVPKKSTPMRAAVLADENEIPDNHVLTVRDRVLSADLERIVQNNVKTDTVTLDLDGEWDDCTVYVTFNDGTARSGPWSLEWKGRPLTIPSAIGEVVGPVAVSVVGYGSDGELRLVTEAAPSLLDVVKSGYVEIVDDNEENKDILSQMVAAGKKAEDAAEAADAAATSATSAASSANSAATSANSAATSANSAAAKANSAAVDAQNAYETLQPYMATIDSCANVLHSEVGPDFVVTADDSFPCKPVEMTVYGQTRQNLWTNPSGTALGVTITPNGDGSVTVEGTSTGIISPNSGKRYILKPSTSYTISVDNRLSGSPADPSNGCFFVEQHSQDDLVIPSETRYVGYGNTLSVTFTTSRELSYAYMGVFAAPGKTLSGTYRVMLNEGSEAQPWCPPGLNSVEELSIVTAGKNLFAASQEAFQVQGKNGSNQIFSIGRKAAGIPIGTQFVLSFDYRLSSGAGTATVQQNSSPYLSLGVSYTPLSGDNEWHKVVGNVITVNENMRATNLCSFRLDNVSGLLDVKNLQLELGSTPTDYEPPAVTTTPIDLDGHTLNSLPDGTRDELRIDGGGNVVLEKRTGIATYDGSEDEAWLYEGSKLGLNNGAPGSEALLTNANGRCDTLPVREVNSSPAIMSYSTGRVDIRNDAAITDSKSGKAWLAANHTTLIYPLAAPQTIDLGTITPPTTAAPNVTAYVAGDTPAEMTLDYVRDVNIVHSRLEERVAALELASATS